MYQDFETVKPVTIVDAFDCSTYARQDIATSAENSRRKRSKSQAGCLKSGCARAYGVEINIDLPLVWLRSLNRAISLNVFEIR